MSFAADLKNGPVQPTAVDDSKHTRLHDTLIATSPAGCAELSSYVADYLILIYSGFTQG